MGNIRILFADKDDDGLVRQSADASSNEVLGVYNYSAFGLELGGSQLNTSNNQNRFTYNGKEKIGFSGYLDYGWRMYDRSIGRFTSIDPLAEVASNLTPFRFGFNNPITYTDLDGLFESRKAARQYARENDIRTGLFSGSRIEKQNDGSFSIISTKVSNGNINQTFTQDFGGDIGVSTGVIVRANDNVDRDRGWFSDDVTLRDGSVANEWHTDVLPIGSGIGATTGIIAAGYTGSRFKTLTTAKEIINALRKTLKGRVSFIQNGKKITVKLPEGFSKVKLSSHGQKVYSDGKRWITPDTDGHIGGIWKLYDKVSNVGRGKSFRVGTFDEHLNKIGG